LHLSATLFGTKSHGKSWPTMNRAITAYSIERVIQHTQTDYTLRRKPFKVLKTIMSINNPYLLICSLWIALWGL